MLYPLLGRLTWFVGRRVLRRRFGRFMLPAPLLAASIALPLLRTLVRRIRRNRSEPAGTLSA